VTGFSWNLADDVGQLFAYHFMVNAFFAGTIVAVVAGGIGWFMVLRRQSFAGHTLAIVSFPGAAGAILLGISASYGYFGAAVAAAIVIALVPRSSSGRAFSNESAVIGTVQAFALACGALFVSLYGGFLNSLTDLLFGTFLGVSDDQVRTLLLVGAAALIILAGLARPLFFATVDPDVARARGVPVGFVSTVYLVLLGVAAAEVSQITGALLVFALLVMPAAAAQQLTVRPAVSFALTMCFGLASVWLGLSFAYFSIYPVGFFVTSVGFAIFVMASGCRALRSRLAMARSGRQPVVRPA
jgi:zinc/manganese transport system permease protein